MELWLPIQTEGGELAVESGEIPFKDVIVDREQVEALAVVRPDGVVDLLGCREGGQFGQSL